MLVAQNIPQELVGKWVIQRELPMRTISCWGEKEAKAIIGTEIEYTADSFRWKHIVVKHPTVTVAVVSAEQFQSSLFFSKQSAGTPKDSPHCPE